MQRRSIVWIIVVGMCLLGGWCVWHWSASNPASGQDTVAASMATSGSSAAPSAAAPAVSAPAATNKFSALRRDPLEFRVSNTTQPLDKLMVSDTAILLENANVDTASGAALPIPEHLRARGEPGAYVVQARGVVDDAFRAALKQSGVTPVSYIPNNAWLVEGTRGQAQWLLGQGAVRSAIAFEPYFKVKGSLLPYAVEQLPLPVGAYLNVVLFGGARAATLTALNDLGVKVITEGPSPFGAVLTVQPRPETLVAIASLPGVQLVERAAARVPANDLSRVRVGVSTDTLVTENYFGLTGANVLVAVADSGVDPAHPDLAGRVVLDLPAAGIDTEGHGTHVAGTIAGSGAASAGLVDVPGSVAGASFRGKAPAAGVYAIQLNVSPTVGLGYDAYAQQQAALTNALIMNNSWRSLDDQGYTITAASYDAAVRDALPFQPGSQPLTVVFAAGNEGAGNDSGASGRAGSVGSPATGKNVITVGALEQLRNITNEVATAGVTNKPWEGQTDSDNEVAPYSSRGNVGIGVEGLYGRFKPDVVAPGSWVVSAQSKDWDEAAYYSITNENRMEFNDLTVEVGGLDQFAIFAPPAAVGIQIQVITTNPAVDMPIYVRAGGGEPPTATDNDFAGTNVVNIPPDLPLTTFESYQYAIGNPTNIPVTYDIVTITTVTNDRADEFRVLKELNDALGSDYRYESGTSMAAPTVSGMLALIQQYFQEQLGRTNSPALMKALLINGARTASSTLYDLQVQSPINYQGWGLVNLPTSLPPSSNGVPVTGTSSFVYFDQEATNGLATSQSFTRNVDLGPAAVGRPLRFTLVWTDPPGNPAAGIKLVNDLDLVVSNLTSGEVYYGNDIPTGSDFTFPTPTNGPLNRDFVNNVENVYLAEPTNTTFSVTVVGRRVNVNAVTAHPDNVVQDFALVISTGDGEVSEGLTVAPPTLTIGDSFNLTVITNTLDSQMPLFNQTVGANTPLLSTTTLAFSNRVMSLGVTNQWHFYVATNYGTNGNFTNAAFITFQPPTLSVPRLGPWSTIEEEISRPEADIDMYVSTEAALTNLDATVLQNAWSSIGRGGTEVVTLTNAVEGNLYYIGIKSEDQMAGQYGFFSVFSDVPFSQRDEEGNIIVRGVNVPAEIPDGNNEKPGVALVFAISTEVDKVRKVTVTNTITHEQMGDLFGNLSHNSSFAVLHNHTFGSGAPTETFIYDDSGSGSTDTKKSDGPGSLQDFVTDEAAGLWLLTMLDDSPSATGRVNSLTLKVEPQRILEEGDILTLAPNTWGYTFVEVPVGATNLTVSVSWTTANATLLPVELYIRRGDFPTFTEYDKKATISPPGGSLSISRDDIPPLQAGTYYIGVFNPNSVDQQVLVKATIELDLDGVVPFLYQSTNVLALFDDAVTNSTIFVETNEVVARVEVGVRLNHPRVSDLALQLVSPEGTRVLLFENRGGLDTNGLGADLSLDYPDLLVTNGGFGAYTTNLDVFVTNGTLTLTYDFMGTTNSLAVYDSLAVPIFSLIEATDAATVSIPINGTNTLYEIRVNEGGSADPNAMWTLTVSSSAPIGYLHSVFTEATNKVSEPQSLLKFVPPPFNVPNPSNVLASVFSNGIYYLPEESLDVLKGEESGGDWTLEIWDSRVGATNPGPELLEWNLSFVFEQKEIPFIRLEPYVAITSSVPAGGFEYLLVDVPPWAIAATNYLLNASDFVLTWFNQDVAPTGVEPPDTLFFGGAVTNGVQTLVTNGVPPPPLVPGQQYYLAIQNTNLTPVVYSFRVDFDITALTNMVPFVGVTDTNGFSRYFTYDVSTNASAVMFELYGLDGNLDLVARQGPPLPTRFDNDYFSINPGLNDEQIVVFTNGTPVALQPGVWYLGVLNGTANAVNYNIMATEFTNAFPQIITLTNAIPYANTNDALPGTEQFYRYVVTTNAARVQFEIFGATGDFTLLASRGLPLPTLFNFDYRSANSGTNDEVIVIITNSMPVNLTSGDWFLSAVKISGGPADYSIMATEWPETARPVQLISSGVVGTDYCLTWASLPGVHYYVQGRSNLLSPMWTTVSPQITAIDFATTWCTPLPTPYAFFRVVEGVVISPSPALPTVITGFTVTPGLVTLSWFGPLDASFQVEWTDSLIPAFWQPAGPPITTTTGIFTFTDDGTLTAPFGGGRYYRLIQLP